MLLFLLVLSGLAFGDYTVKFGDSLSKIAQNELGDGDRWKEIAELNGLKRPYKLEVGQTLKMPEGAVEESNEGTFFEEEEEDGTEFDFDKVLDKAVSIALLLLVPGAPLVLMIIYVLALTFLWALSMRLNCNVMILPEKASLGQCLLLAFLHFFLIFCYFTGNFLLVRVFNGNFALYIPSVVILVLVIIILILYSTKKVINIGWFWSFLFLIFSYTITQLLYLLIVVLIFLAVVSLYAVASIF